MAGPKKTGFGITYRAGAPASSLVLDTSETLRRSRTDTEGQADLTVALLDAIDFSDSGQVAPCVETMSF